MRELSTRVCCLLPASKGFQHLSLNKALSLMHRGNRNLGTAWLVEAWEIIDAAFNISNRSMVAAEGA